jgi:hypothetical protein
MYHSMNSSSTYHEQNKGKIMYSIDSVRKPKLNVFVCYSMEEHTVSKRHPEVETRLDRNG